MTRPLGDPAADAVLARLNTEGRRQLPALILHYLPRLPRLLLGGRLDWERDQAFYADKLIAIEPAQGRLLHLLARAARAKVVVEFGSSLGVSTIYLAAAVRDNGGGIVIATEKEAAKAAAARENWREAGVDEYIELREGDAFDTLRHLDRTPVDMVLLDGWPHRALDVLRLIEPHLRDGAIVCADNVGQFRADLAGLVAHLADPDRYMCERLPLRGGTLVAVYRKQQT